MKKRVEIVLPDVPAIPKELQPAILRELRLCEKYLPHWLTRLDVQFITNPGDDDEGTTCSTEPQPEYFRAVIRFYPAWLDDAPAERHHTLLHEIGHLHNAHALQFAATMTDKFAGEDDPQEMIKETRRIAFEQSAESFAIMIERLEQTGGRKR